jgi:hypothetical protein
MAESASHNMHRKIITEAAETTRYAHKQKLHTHETLAMGLESRDLQREIRTHAWAFGIN